MAAALAADAVIPVDAVDLAVVPAAVSGSSFFCAAVVETATDSWETMAVDVTMAADVVDLTTPACGSFSCCFAAADAARILSACKYLHAKTVRPKKGCTVFLLHDFTP